MRKDLVITSLKKNYHEKISRYYEKMSRFYEFIISLLRENISL